MVGYSLKKLAKEYEMTISHGVAFGVMNGYAATFSEGMGYKRLCITTTIPDLAQRDKLRKILDTTDLRKQFRITELLFAGDGILVNFYDNLGTMKKIRQFITWIFPLLDEHGATGIAVCTRCGNQIDHGCWKLLDGAAYYMHEDCGLSFQQAHEAGQEVLEAEKTGSYFTGFLGALGGAMIGAAVWAFVLYQGYIASLVGFLIGWMAEKGYHMFHGKKGKGKILILVVVILLAVLLGTVSSDVISLAQMIRAGEFEGFTYGDIPWMMGVLLTDSEYLSGTGRNLLTGVLFAALGVYALLHKAGRGVTSKKVISLE